MASFKARKRHVEWYNDGEGPKTLAEKKQTTTLADLPSFNDNSAGEVPHQSDTDYNAIMT